MRVKERRKKGELTYGLSKQSHISSVIKLHQSMTL